MDIINQKEKVAVYIDGSNFYGYLKDKEIGFPNGVKVFKCSSVLSTRFWRFLING